MKKFLLASAAAFALLAARAEATISSPTVQVIDLGNGSTTVFNYSFLIPFQADGVTPAVRVQTEDPNGNLTILASNQYSISGVGNGNGGSVTYNPGGIPLPSGWSLIITRALNYVQPIAVSNYSFYPHTVEVTSDNLAAQIQQLAARTTFLFPPGDSSFQLPPASQRENTLLGFDSAGNATLVAQASGSLLPLPLALINGGTGSATGQMNQVLAHTFWNPGARINYFTDRAMVGACVVNQGSAVAPSPDWLGQSGITNDADFAQFCSFTDPASPAAAFAGPQIAGLFAASTVGEPLGATPRATECILWNQAAINLPGWCRYGEYWITGTTTFNVYGDEMDGVNRVAVATDWDPYNEDGPASVGMLQAEGGSRSGTLFPGTAAFQIADNGSTWGVGLDIRSSALCACSVGSTKAAVKMAFDSHFQWFASKGVIAADLASDASNHMVALSNGLQTNKQIYPGTGSAVQTGGGLLAGTGNPGSGVGNNGDFYFRTDCTHGSSDCTWHKESGSWQDLN